MMMQMIEICKLLKLAVESVKMVAYAVRLAIHQNATLLGSPSFSTTDLSGFFLP
ncbi:hypothetical protein SLEP1_g31248 [Rubroshorea leprosula]|uniref:Uncharacterized protein n=1 Tax=Rubroshorea leprosula TaxID=152421 RepID=A0AAV5KB54_9ROSI|nr:hypothetical protein SLEP1_g31248 [Rubroshorea leprosula]